MVEIYINKNEGLTSAIKTKLNKQGYDTSNINNSIWTQVMQEVASENSKNLKEGKEAIYKGGSDLSASGHENFVVDKGAKELTQSLWDKIVSIVTSKTTNNNKISTEKIDTKININKIN